MTTTGPGSPMQRGGLLASARAGLNAGLMVGFWAGLLDGVVAGRRTETHGLGAWLGCLAGAVFVYALFWCAALIAASLALHPWLRTRDLRGRLRLLTSIGIGGAVAVDLYWWSREYLYYGVPASDPRRLAVAAGALALGLATGWLVARFAGRAPRGAKLAVVVLVPVAILGGLAYVAAQKATSDERGALNARNRDLPNVLLFVVDALRADALGCYGNARARTPVIDGLAARGVLFENAHVQAPFTWSSFGSILTGKYVRRHGLLKMAADAQMPVNVTLPWHLKNAVREDGTALEPDDYTTAAFLTGTLSHHSGLARGFDAYYEQMVGHVLVEVESPWSVFRSELLLFIFRNKLEQRIEAAPVASEACAWLAANGAKRFAAKVHLYSTHTPYDPPEPYRSAQVDPAYKGPIRDFYSDHRVAIEERKYVLTDADAAQIRNLYQAGADQADAMIGQVLDAVRKAGVLENTLVIVTGDHGEELGDHGLWEHNWMFQTNLRVPLVMALPGKLPAGARVAAQVDSIDILPTICALAGIRPPGLDAKDELEKIDGASLLPLIRGEVVRQREFSFAENGLYLSIQDQRFKLFLRGESLDDAGWTKALAGDPERPHFFDLASDPGETRDALAEFPREAERLRDALRAWDRALPIRRDAMQLSPRDRRDADLLKRLGYADGVGAGTKGSRSIESPGGGKPKDGISAQGGSGTSGKPEHK